jgi:hypothetical protein
VLGFKAVGATLLPFASLRVLLGNFLLLRAVLLNWLTGLTLVDSLVAVVLLLAPGLLRVLILLLLLGVLLRVPVLLLLLDLLLVLILLLLLGALLRIPVLLLLLDLRLVLILLLLLGTLLWGWLILLLLGMLLGVWPRLLLLRVLLRRWFLLLLLLGMWLRGWPLLFLLGSLLRRFRLPVGPSLLIAFLLLLCVPEHGGSKKQCKNRRSNDSNLLHRYFLNFSMNPKERRCCPLLNIVELCRRSARASPVATPNADMFISEQKFVFDASTMALRG